MSGDERAQLEKMLDDFKDRMLADMRELFSKVNTADRTLAVLAEVQRSQQSTLDSLRSAIEPLRDRVSRIEHQANDHAAWCKQTHKQWDEAVAARKRHWWDIEKAVLIAVLVSVALGAINVVWNATNRSVTETVARQVQQVIDEERTAGGPAPRTRETRP